MKKTVFLLCVLVCLFSASVAEPVSKPLGISPGNETGMAMVNHQCPTFSWTAVDWAKEYQLVVFVTDGSVIPAYSEISAVQTPVLLKRFRGKAFAWTPSSMEGLAPGMSYIWYVQARDEYESEVWSSGRIFRIELPVIPPGVEEKLREKLKEYGLDDEKINNVFAGASSPKDDSPDKTTGIPDGVTGSENDGSGNVYYGAANGDALTSGTYNSFFGYNAGDAVTTGNFNVLAGSGAGTSLTTGNNNTFLGTDAGWNSSNDDNTFVGYYAGRANTTGGGNTFIGSEAGKSLSGAYHQNTFVGYNSGAAHTTGSFNCYIGGNTAWQNTSGTNNIFLGHLAGYHETGSHKLYIESSGTDKPLIYGDFNTNELQVNGNLTMSNTGTTTYFTVDRTDGSTFKLAAGVANTQIGSISNHGIKFTTNNTWKMLLNANGTLDMADGGSYNGTWNDASSIEYKENIRELSSDEARYALEELNPVIYNYKKYKDEERVGFIAEHVPGIVANNDRKNISAMDIVAVLTKVVKEQRETIEQLSKRIEKLEAKK